MLDLMYNLGTHLEIFFIDVAVFLIAAFFRTSIVQSTGPEEGREKGTALTKTVCKCLPILYNTEYWENHTIAEEVRAE